MMPPTIVIAGPTASGKSALALALAERLDGVVINADSMQLYDAFRILTARPGPQEAGRVPHRLYGVLPATDTCSAARWRDLAMAEIEAARSARRQPILVGGTGLYLRSLMDGIAAIPTVPAEVRAAAMERYTTMGGEAFRAALVEKDPASARLPPGDRQRLIRAWEVLAATGVTLSQWQATTSAVEARHRYIVLVLLPERSALYRACDDRFRRMVAAGALDEVAAVDALGLDPGLTAMKALGVPELRAHLRGEFDLETAIGLAQQATRRYAKRQVTWFRHQLLEANRDRPDRPCLALERSISTSVAQFSVDNVPAALAFVLRFR